MKVKIALIALFVQTVILIGLPVQAGDLTAILSGEHRSDENKARDQFRNPQQVLEFFGVQPEDHVLEMWPGSGWYSEILAPYIKGKGIFSAATFATDNLNSDDKRYVFWSKVAKKYREKMSDSELYGLVHFSVFQDSKFEGNALPEKADVILIVRTLHVWDEMGQMQQSLNNLYKILKPGGVLGIVQHRANSISEIAATAGEGYMDQRYVVEAAEQAGFKLEATSEINQNLKDTKDYPKGVYALPPTLAMGKLNKKKYLAIGESDRMTLKFIKPNF